MSRTLKIAILWFLVFALPIQGLASAGMLACVGAHHHLIPGTSHHDREAEQEDAHPDAFSSGDFHQGVAADNHSAAENTSSEGSQHHGTAKCNACSSCCLTTAISFPVWLEPIAPIQTGLESNVHSDGRFAAHFPEGLERPPQSLDS